MQCAILHYNSKGGKRCPNESTNISSRHQRTGQSPKDGVGECTDVWIAIPTNRPENRRRMAKDKANLLARQLKLRANESPREFRQEDTSREERSPEIHRVIIKCIIIYYYTTKLYNLTRINMTKRIVL